MARALIALLALLFAAPASAQTFNGQQQAEIRAIVREYLVNNPDVLREAIDSLQARTDADRWRTIKSDPRDFSIGPADAPITIVEFYDYRCGFCHAAQQWVMDLQRSRRDVRIVLKEFPILTPQSMEAARAALAAAPQGRYWQFHTALMAHPLDQELSSDAIDRIARSVGIDVPRMRRAMGSEDITRLLEDNRGHALDLSPNPATPLFMINGEMVQGFNQEQLERRLREATQEARQRRARR